MTVRNLICLPLYPWVVRWSADLLSTDYWLFSVSELIFILVKLGQSCLLPNFHMFSSAHLSILFPVCSVNFPTQRVWIKIQIMALFSNQKYEFGPKAVIPTYSQVISIKLSGGLSKSSGTLLCEVLEVPR